MLLIFVFALLRLANAASNASCTATTYLQIPGVVANCTEIILQDIALPDNVALDLTKLQPNSVVTFAGRTVSLLLKWNL